METVNVASKGNVHYVTREVTHTVPNAETISVDDLLSSLVEDDPEFEALFADANKWVGETFYEGERSIASLRLAKGWTQNDLAKEMQTSQSQIAKIESGKKDPQFSTVIKLAEALSVKVGDLAEIIAESRNEK